MRCASHRSDCYTHTVPIQIAEANSLGDNGMRFLWSVALLICDAVFIYWIFTALRQTMVSNLTLDLEG